VRRLFIICEGQTEEQFVREVLARHLLAHGVEVRAPLIGRPGHKGGAVTWDRMSDDLRRLLRGDAGAVATTLIDYYGLDGGFPGVADAKTKATSAAKAQAVQVAMAQAAHEQLELGPERFLPYVQMHEFEGLLFSDPDAFAVGIGKSALADKIRAITQAFSSPEDINDRPEKAPSKRIAYLMPGYDKPLHGVLAALQIELPQMRQACGLFNEWMLRLEALGSAGGQAGT
jgi:hypothetical protein